MLYEDERNRQVEKLRYFSCNSLTILPLKTKHIKQQINITLTLFSFCELNLFAQPIIHLQPLNPPPTLPNSPSMSLALC